MPDWKSDNELARDGLSFGRLMHALAGLYFFEWFISLDFDVAFLTGRKRFKWPMIFYFANRYLLLFAMIGILVALDATSEVNCQTLHTFNQLAGDAAVGLASINLSIRTVAIWSQNRYIIIVLVLTILGHWSLILQGVQLKAIWVPGTGCVITETHNKLLGAIFIYSMCFDFTVLMLNTYKLFGIAGKTSPRELLGRSRLTHIIFADGLMFFIIAFLANVLATTFMALNLNSIMSVIFNVPAAVFSTIVACRAVRRLTNFTHQSPDIYGNSNSSQPRPGVAHAPSSSTRGSVLGFSRYNLKSGGGAGRLSMGHVNGSGVSSIGSGVHVQMETFTHPERKISEVDFYPRPIEKDDGALGSETDVDVEMNIQRKIGYQS